MPSTNKTPNFGLNQWIGSDKPMREDFNADNSIIDTALKGKADKGIPGSWTPMIAGDTVAGTHAYSAQEGYYYRIGDLMFATFHIFLSTKDSSAAGNVRITGLPGNRIVTPRTGGSIALLSGITTSGAATLGLIGELKAINIYQFSSTGTTSAVSISNVSNTFRIQGSIVYQVADA